MKFKLKFILTFFFFLLPCYNSYILKIFNEKIEKKYFYYNKKKKKFSSYNYFSYIPFLNESTLKKNLFNFRIFLNNKKTREADNYDDLNNITNAISKNEFQLDKRLEQNYINEKNENYIDINKENGIQNVNKNNDCVINKNEIIKKSKKTICDINEDFPNEYSDDINEKNKEKNSTLKENYNSDDDLYTLENSNDKDKYNCENPYLYSNSNNSFKSSELDEKYNEISKENDEIKKEYNELLEKNDKIDEENNSSFNINNDDCKKININEKKKKKKNMDIKIVRNLPLISIIGRPNVGKSTIFNRLTRKFQKGNIVLDVSSTRDKVYGEVEWEGYKFEVVDTGGLIFEDENFSKEIRDQILLSLSESSVVLLVVDGLKGIDPLDIEICKFLRKYIGEEYKKVFPKGENQENNFPQNEEKIKENEIHNLKNKKEYTSCENVCENGLSDKNEKLINNVQNHISYDNNTEFFDISNKNGKEIEDKDECKGKHEDKYKNDNESTTDDINVNKKYKKNSSLKVIICVNKCESHKDGYYKSQDFWELGFGNPFPCSGIHGNGLSEILDECIKYIKKVKIDELDEEEIEKNTINISFIGKPNTGKSSILNKILNCNRFIVSPIAGTTVDSIDVLIKIKNSERLYRLIDTAGIQKRKKNVPFNEKTKYEYLLYNRTEKAIRRSDVCVLVIDSFNGISSHDINIARKILKENKSCIICCNKWDLIHNKNDIFNDTKNYVLNLLKPIDFANILFISAKTSQRLLNIFEHAEETYKNYTKKVNTRSLNQIIKEALLLRPPIPVKNKSLKIYYAFQAHIKPPGFVLFCNSEKSVYSNYTKYLESRIRDTFNIKGTPIKIYYKQRRLRNIIKKTKNPDKYNLDVEAIQKNFLKIHSNNNSVEN
ncbi:GTP binding protein, putative [Plasmodium gallinaceum]|uniref:GTPase Der n=1 Tax=Plasmodium gallinaceum TaxID=5849 RepID=A0A1J1GZ58_PLAGA|nr:GTP binding protein, putative [Plasmodium gallinaceum]CRG97741.1 GTP binding protein, putative [Plasmodium gallinaceum]